MFRRNLDLGKSGEEQALIFLKNKGYKIIKANYKSKLGEVDIIAEDKDTICFIEVKTRTTKDMGLPEESITQKKMHQITKAALTFLRMNNLWERNARFDVVSVLSGASEEKIELIQNAFELEPRYRY